MKRKELDKITKGVELYNEAPAKSDVRLTFKIHQNNKLVNAEKIGIEETRKTLLEGEKYKEFEQKRNDIVKQYAEKNSNGDIIPDENGNIKLDDVEGFNNAMSDLSKKYKEVLDDQMESMKKFNELLDDEIDLNFSLLTKDDVKKLKGSVISCFASWLPKDLKLDDLNDKTISESELDYIIQYVPYLN